MSASLRRLAELLRERGGLLATLLWADAEQRAGAGVDGSPAQLASAGPRTGGAPQEYELLIDAIYEGYLLHYGAPRILRARDPDLGLLAGDQLYALGLDRLVRLGDVAAVSELADVITLCSLAQGAGEPQLADAVWEAGARAIGWGASAEHEAAKELVRQGSPGALGALRGLPAH